MILAVSGPSGSGKTTLTSYLGESTGSKIVEEPQPRPLLDTFSEEPRANCALLQRTIIGERRNRILAVQHDPLVIIDRTITEDRCVFLDLHHRLGYLSDEQYRGLCELAIQYESEVPSPQALLFLWAPVSVLRERVSRNREDPIPVIESLEIQWSLYERWRKSLQIPYVHVDTSLVDIASLCELGNWFLISAGDVIHHRKHPEGARGCEWNMPLPMD